LAVSWALLAEPDAAAALALLRERDPGAAEVLAEVAVQDSEAEPDDVGALLVGAAAERRLREVEAATRVAEDPLAHSAEVRRLTLGIEGLREVVTRPAAAADLLDALRAAAAE
jgi:hypothetical protein